VIQTKLRNLSCVLNVLYAAAGLFFASVCARTVEGEVGSVSGRVATTSGRTTVTAQAAPRRPVIETPTESRLTID